MVVGYGSVNGRKDGQQTFHAVSGQIEDSGVTEMMGSDGRGEMAASLMVKRDK